MSGERTSLKDAFLEDHRRLTQGFAELMAAIDRNDIPAARKIAERVDGECGPHIEFEETILYPELRKARGKGFADQMYAEHHVGLGVIRRLVDLPPGRPLLPEERRELRNDAQMMLDHVVGCGTLLSHLLSRPAQEQTRLLDRLLEYRQHNCRWTELEIQPAR